jgi:predicted Ser/Thr protein kinase/cytochrome c-type biogenesis protein CcmH/NrfG
MPFAAGENVGSYRIIEKLGQGGMATVFKAYHPALDRFVAIKVLHPAFKEDPQFLERFKREARVVARLEHTNIVPVYDFAEHEGQPYLVMKFIDGETLKARLQRSRLLKDEAYKVIRAVGAALSYAHGKGVLHRDVKPSNILMAEDGQVYLTDFGLARMAEAGASTLTGDMLMGTPHYISPEQARGEKDLTGCTDIYSFGIVLYEIVVGRVPFSADTPFSIIHDHIYTPLPLPSEVNPKVPEEIQQVLLKALAKNPEDRYESGNKLVEAFFATLDMEDRKVVVPIEMEDTKTIEAERHPIETGAETELKKVTEAESIETGTVKKPSARRKINRKWLWIAAGIIMTCLTLFSFLVVANQPGIRTLFDDENTASAEDMPIEGEFPSNTIEESLKLIDERPYDPEAHLQLAEAYRSEGMDQESAEQYMEAGKLLIDQQRFIEGVKALNESILLQGGLKNADRETVEMVIEILFMSAVDQNLAPMYEKSALQFPNWDILKICEARSYLYRNEIGRAQDLLDEALRRDPESQIAKAVMAEITFHQGRNEAALSQVQGLLNQPRIPSWLEDFLRDLEDTIRSKME